MMVMGIDYNKGVHIRRASNGIDVCMYVDDPGVFLSMLGTPVHEELAKSAGFDVDNLGRLRLRKERMKQAQAMIDAEFSQVGPEAVIAERNGVKLVSVGNGRYAIKDGEGVPLSDKFFTEDEGKLLFNQLAPEQPASAPLVPLKDKPPEQPAS